MRNIIYLIVISLFLSSCSEIQLGSHVAKEIMPPPKSEGTFKVGTPYKIAGKRYYPRESYDLTETGIASWYGHQFHGKQTANGETFDMYELTAAHRTLQMPSLVRVTNLENGRSLIVRVNDRGPYKKGRVIDLSMRAAELLGFKGRGTAKVRLEVLTQESLRIAQAAKSGINTRGYEVALNQGGALPPPPAPQPVSAAAAPMPEPAIAPASGAPQQIAHIVPGHTRNGAFYPDPVVMEMPVTPTDIYIQAGSFTVRDNAYRLSAQMQRFARTDVYPAMVNGRQFHRVRLGPIRTVEEADALLDRVTMAGGTKAIIVVE